MPKNKMEDVVNAIGELTTQELKSLTNIIALTTGNRKEKEELQALRQVAYNRICKTSTQPLIMLDFDGVLCKFEWPGVENYDPLELGEPTPIARDLLHALVKIGHVQINTQRMNFVSLVNKTKNELVNKILDWLTIHRFDVLDGFPTTFNLFPLTFHVVNISDSNIRIKKASTVNEVLGQVNFALAQYENDRQKK